MMFQRRALHQVAAAIAVSAVFGLLLMALSTTSVSAAASEDFNLSAPAEVTLELDQCDPAMGEVESVTIMVDGEVVVDYELISLSAVDIDAEIDATANLDVTLPPPSAALNAAGTIDAVVPLAAGGEVLDMVTDALSTSVTITDATELAVYTGTGTVPVTLDFTGVVTTVFPGGNGLGGGTNSATGTVSIDCVFATPPTATPVPPTPTPTPTSTPTPTPEPTPELLGLMPGISIEKSTNGEDADNAPGPFVATDGLVTWTYFVENTGNVALVDVVVVDDVVGPVECPQDFLFVGETMTCTASGDAVPGQYRNDATVTARSPEGAPVSDNDPSHYFGTAPAIDVEKSTNGQDADTGDGPIIRTGEAVTWTYVVRNTGNVELTNVSVTDNQIGPITCPKTSLAVGESMTCTANGRATSGAYENTATVNGTDPTGATVNDDDPSRYTGRNEPGIDIEKATNGYDADEAPGPELLNDSKIVWTYAVRNTGQTVLIDVEVTDSQGVELRCPLTILQVGGGMVCTGGGTATTIGQYVNIGTVTATNPEDDTQVFDSDPSHYFGKNPPPTPTPIPTMTPVPTPVPKKIVPAKVVPTKVVPAKVVPAKVVPPKKSEPIAVTGTESFPLGLTAASMIGVGMMVLGVSHRRRTDNAS